MRTELQQPDVITNQGIVESLLSERDYSGLKIVQAQALNVFSHFTAEGSLGNVIQSYIGQECYSRNRPLLEAHRQKLGVVYDDWNRTNKDDLFYSLFGVEKAELTADPSDTFLTGRELGHELFADGQLDQVVGFATANYKNFQRDVTIYLVQQLCRIHFLNPEVRVGTAARRWLSSNEELSQEHLSRARIARGLFPYSEEENQILIRLWLDGLPRKEIASTIGRTESAIQNQVARLDLPVRRDTQKWEDEEVADLLKVKNERHLTHAQLAEVFDRSERSVQHKLLENNVLSFRRKLWEEEEVKKLGELLVDEYSWNTVLQKLSADFPRGRTIVEVKAKARRSDFRLKTQFEVKRIQFEQLVIEGLSEPMIAKKLGVGRHAVSKWKKRLETEKGNN